MPCCGCLLGSFVTSSMSSRPCVKSRYSCFSRSSFKLAVIGLNLGQTRVRPGSEFGLTHCKPGLDLGLACALAILRCDANMNKKGSLLFCAFNGCPQELDFKTGWRKACHSKGKFYGALKHNCGTPSEEVSCGYISRALAIGHKFQFVDRDSEEGKKLQKETGWSRTDFDGIQGKQVADRKHKSAVCRTASPVCLLVEQMLHLTPVMMFSGLCHRFREEL